MDFSKILRILTLIKLKAGSVWVSLQTCTKNALNLTKESIKTELNFWRNCRLFLNYLQTEKIKRKKPLECRLKLKQTLKA